MVRSSDYCAGTQFEPCVSFFVQRQGFANQSGHRDVQGAAVRPARLFFSRDGGGLLPGTYYGTACPGRPVRVVQTELPRPAVRCCSRADSTVAAEAL
jgi:hypothetical protein